MPTIRERAGKFHVQVRMHGFPSRTASFTTRRLAERWATTVEAEMIEGRHFKSSVGRRRTVSEAAIKYAREVLHVEGVPAYEPGPEFEARLSAFLKQRWVPPKHPDAPADARNSLRRLMWWRNELRNHKVADVTTELIEERLSKLRTQPYQRSKPDQKNSVVHGQPPRLLYRTEKTVNRYISAGSRLFKIVYRRWHWITSNPFAGIERAGEHGGRTKILTAEERDRLFREVRRDDTLHAFSSTALATVVRAGDLQKLRKSDVDLVEGRIAIQQPKNKEPRIVWISGAALEVLRAHIVSSDPNEPRVFVSPKGKLYRYHKAFVEACGRAGLAGFTFHGFRHCGATYLARLGATEQQLRAIGGWKSNVVRRYVHLAAEDARAIVTRMNADILGPKVEAPCNLSGDSVVEQR